MNDPKSTQIRAAVAEDAAAIARHRRLMLAEIEPYAPDVLAETERLFAAWAGERLASGEYRGWLAVVDGEIVAGVGVWLRERLYHPRNLAGREGYITNVYTEPAFRGEGCARRLMHSLLGWCKTAGLPWVRLNTTRYGRHLYETLGFTTDPDEMRLNLRDYQPAPGAPPAEPHP